MLYPWSNQFDPQKKLQQRDLDLHVRTTFDEMTKQAKEAGIDDWENTDQQWEIDMSVQALRRC